MTPQGLTSEQVRILKAQYGDNSLQNRNENSALKVLWEQFRSPIIYLLLITSVVTMLFGEWTDAFLILAVLVFDVIFGFYQEYNAQKTLSKLKGIIDPQTTVIRNGKRQKLATHELVPGDVVVLGAGDIVPADGALLESVNLLVKESILTGEQEAVNKVASDHNGPKDATVFMGTSVLSGGALMQVTHIGKDTEFGKIGLSLLSMDERETPLQKSLEKFSHQLTWYVAGISAVIFAAGVIYQHPLWESARFAIVLAIAAVPEGLPIVVTVILSLGMKRILKEKGLVKNLLSVETLGSTTVICTDKTGTLTEGNMRVVESHFNNKDKVLQALLMNNEQRTNMELAMYDFALKQEGAPEKYLESAHKTYQEPFSSETKYSFTIAAHAGKETAFITGAPEHIYKMCTLSAAEVKYLEQQVSDWADEGLRVIAAAYKDTGDLKQKQNMQFAGLIGIDDPIRASAKASLAEAQRAGIKVKIITGDYRKTAEKIAAALGLDIQPDEIMEGTELEEISLAELRKKIGRIELFARVSPQHKLKIIEALQANGEVVAMTGDGVNDVLALKKADIGIAMGNSSDVAKEAADLILLDNDFQTIVSTCEEGRLVFMNIKKVIGYILSNSFAEIALIFGATLLRFPTPLLVAQILWVHLICDGPPDIILGFDHDKAELLRDKPRDHRKEHIFDSRLRWLVFAVSGSIALLAFGMFNYIGTGDSQITLSRSLVFAFLCLISLVYIFSYKDLDKPLWKMTNLGENKLLFGAIAYGVVLTLAALYVPFLNNLLGTTPIDLSHWVIVLGAAAVVVVVVEVVKVVARRKTSVKI